MILWKDLYRLGGTVVPTWMSRLDDWKEALMDRLGNFLWIVKITHFKKPLERIIDYQHRHSFLFHISELFSLFNFILSQTNRNNLDLPTYSGTASLSSVSKANKFVTRTKINPEIIRLWRVRMEIDYDFACFLLQNVELIMVCRSDA